VLIGEVTRDRAEQHCRFVFSRNNPIEETRQKDSFSLTSNTTV